MPSSYQLLPLRDPDARSGSDSETSAAQYKSPSRQRFFSLTGKRLPRSPLPYLILGGLLLLLINAHWFLREEDLVRANPELWSIVTEPVGHGGRWRIPQSWLDAANSTDSPSLNLNPRSTMEAAELALALSISQRRLVDRSSIPLVVHQTWRSMDPKTWKTRVVQAVHAWLSYCKPSPEEGSPEMAYILWDNDGIEDVMQRFESNFLGTYYALPSMVERTDVFRVVILKWFGGIASHPSSDAPVFDADATFPIYADIDTMPLRSPPNWISQYDLDPWKDAIADEMYEPLARPPVYPYPTDLLAWNSTLKTVLTSSYPPLANSDNVIGAIFGIEADYPPDKDSYWRAGYGFPTQLTNWAIAMTPHHPSALLYQEQVADEVDADGDDVDDAYAVDLTGPVRVTQVVSDWLRDVAGFRWNAISGLKDGGKSKVVHDTLVLAQIGFNPRERGRRDRDARVLHYAQGSWRKFDLIVEYGKFCRTFFGMCRDWGKEKPSVVLPHQPHSSASAPLSPRRPLSATPV